MNASNSSPLIGISAGRSTDKNRPTAFSLNAAYIDAIAKAGGVPVMVSAGLSSYSYKILVSKLSGLLLSGGVDIAPDQYQETPDDRAKGVDPDLDRSEFALLNYAIDNKLPFMGICRGAQVVNVALGGTLYVDVKEDLTGGLKHDYYPATEYPRDHYAHSTMIKKGSRLENILGKPELMTNSLHHQGIKDLGDHLEAVAFAPDGLIEAIQHQNNPFGIALQWHPECLPEDPAMQNLFNTFVAEARNYEAAK